MTIASAWLTTLGIAGDLKCGRMSSSSSVSSESATPRDVARAICATSTIASLLSSMRVCASMMSGSFAA